LGHVAQVARVMAKQYREEVGPWLTYLPVLTDHDVPRSWAGGQGRLAGVPRQCAL